MPHLSELHGAATHLAVVAIPVNLVVHGAWLFPASVVTAGDVATINAWLKTLGPPGGGER